MVSFNSKRTAAVRQSRGRPVPPPPSEKITVKNLASQVQGQMAHHCGYVPKDGVHMAFHAAQQPMRNAKQPVRKIGDGFWSRCLRRKSSKTNETSVYLLDESEW